MRFDELVQGATDEEGSGNRAPSVLYSSETFFAAEPRRKAQYEKCFTQFVSALQKRGHDVELVFVERDMEDVLTSNALLQASLGNLKFVTTDPSPYLHYIEGFTWKKSFYFANFPVAHLDFARLVASGDLFGNFVKLACGVDLAWFDPIDPAIDARNSTSDAQIAKGIVMAPMINWLEQFGSLSRFDLFNASQPFNPQLQGATWDALMGNIPLLRDCVRVTARRAIEMFVGLHEALPA
jgi:hypothetical protein